MALTASSPSFAQSVVRNAKENCNKKNGRAISWVREARARLPLRILRGHFFFLAVFFPVTCDEPSKRGTTRSLPLVYNVNLWYLTSTLRSIDTCQNKVYADQYHMTISWAKIYSSSRLYVSPPCAYQVLVFDWIDGSSVKLTSCDQGRVVQKLVNAYPGLKFNPSIKFSCILIFFTGFCLLQFEIIQIQNRRPKKIKRKPLPKVTGLKKKKNSRLSWVSLTGLWTTLPRSCPLRLG